ncbi:MAG TPA: DUF2784 domain-containing protein [Candidimonas sp.]|nr:DUF2784 domain-containing protein [Candidimonas sp.]
MMYRTLADLVLIVHAAFIGFVIFGGVLALWKRWLLWLHPPALIWGAAVIGIGWICPLTPLENSLRRMGEQEPLQGGFIEHYLLAAIYPAGLTRETQVGLAVLLLLGNAAIYWVLWRRSRKR